MLPLRRVPPGEHMARGGDCTATTNRVCLVNVPDGNYAIETEAGAARQCLRKSKEEHLVYPDRYNWGGDSNGACEGGEESVCGVCDWDGTPAAKNVMMGLEAAWKLMRLVDDKYIVLSMADGKGWRCLGFMPPGSADTRAEAYPRLMAWRPGSSAGATRAWRSATGTRGRTGRRA